MNQKFLRIVTILLLVTLLFGSCSIAMTPPSGGNENPPAGGDQPGNTPGDENPGEENPGNENPGEENPGGENPSGENPGDQTPEEKPLGVVINEVCLKNTKVAAPDGGFYDWVELYNTNETEIDLSGLKLTDNKNEKDKFVFPSGTIISANGFLVVYCVGEEVIGTITDTSALYAPFKLSSEGEKIYFYDENDEKIDKVEVPSIGKDTTYGRLFDGSDVLCTLSGSLGYTNDSTVLKMDLVFSHETGFYDAAFDLSIEAPAGYTVYYTLDCSDPTNSTTAKPYTGSISVMDLSGAATYSKNYIKGNGCDTQDVDKCFVVRAAAKDSNGNFTLPVTKNYFIGYQEKTAFHDIPIICLTTTPDDLYRTEEKVNENGDSRKGFFYETDEKREVECPVNFTYLSKDGTYSFDQEVGIRIRGTSTRTAMQKNLNIYARSKYGTSYFPNSIFPDANFTKSIVLRSDMLNELLPGEGFLMDLVNDRDIAWMANYLVSVFVDGEFFGVYFLYERFSEDYVEAHYGVDAKNVWIVKKGGASYGEGNTPEAFTNFRQIYNLMKGTLSNADYQTICEKVDMQSLIDLLCINMYYGNEDFSMAQNISCWRAIELDPTNPYADGKWRFVLYDLDYCLGIRNDSKNGEYAVGGPYEGMSNQVWVVDTFTSPQPFAGKGLLYWEVMQGSLLTVPAFVKHFTTTFMDIANNNFSIERVTKAYLDQWNAIKDHTEPEIRRYNCVDSKGVRRETATIWGDRTGIDSKYGKYLIKRFDYITAFLKTDFNITGSLTSVSFILDPSKCTVEINGFKPNVTESRRWDAKYYTGMELTLKIHPNEEVIVTGLDASGVQILSSNTEEQIYQLKITGSATIAVVYAN